ncbi:hypothetical protein B0T21DRAFT_282949 [Apiosordaria backusii]|uniref:Chromo domain-containing protein n=1 Tax=Apiosordaria backusii TaxID=314023 RepID=A0AA40ELZ4_9PEZI|nr:hypothetical protein B0T21DRAFT_282949 [Apiosordaria backusii]
MFKNVGIGAAERRVSRQEDDPVESDDDNISLTSTVPADDDQEYVVETILAERKNQEGILYYLVQWDATQFDPFWDSTWEPAENLGDELSAQWAETKAKQAAGEMEPFDVDKYFEVQERKEREQKERHRRRNAKRARLGLPLTEPLLTTSRKSSTSRDEDSSDEEASEDDDLEDVTPVSRPKVPKSRQASTSMQKKGIARPISTSTPKSPTKSKAAKSPAVSKANKERPRQASLSGKPTKPVQTAATSDPQTSSSTKKRQATRPPTTGYEGTARKSSKDLTGGLPKSKTKKSDAALGARGSSIRVASSGQKTLMARKSAQKTIPGRTGNIFTSGKIRKKRATIEEVMSNPSKDPKPFSNMHIGRVAQLRSRAREDLAPDPSHVALFPVTKGPAAARRISKDEEDELLSRRSKDGGDDLFVADDAMELHSEPQPQAPSPAPANPAGPTPVSTGLPPESTVLTPVSAGISPTSTGAPPSSKALVPQSSTGTATILNPLPKKRKSVRWNDDENNVVTFHEPEPMDMDVDGPIESNQASASLQPSKSFSHRPPTPPPMLPPQQPEVIPLTQGKANSQKRVMFGKPGSGSEPIQATFTCLPDESAHDGLLASFLAAETLEFSHTCLATAVTTSFNSMVKRALAFGGVLSDTDKRTLTNVATYLRAGMLGLLCACPEYSILIYPTKCEEWNPVQLTGLPVSEKNAASPELDLEYYIFTPHEDYLALLPEPDSVPSKAIGVDKQLPNRQAILQKFFNFDYKKLLPSKPSSTHHFFLAFPDSKLEVRLLFFHWLRASNPDCCIFTSENPGSWHAFQAKLASERTSGVVIVHELLAWVLHRMPNLRYHLFNQDDRWWCLTEPISTLPMFPSTNSLLEEEPVAPGHLQLSRLFPQGTAILLTPSFLVSEPTRALEIIDWFLTYFSKSTTCRLVTAWDIATYLRDLATEKEQDRADLLASPTATESTASLAIEENLKGLSKEDCQCRFLTATKAFELDDLRKRKVPPVGDNEEGATLVYAIESIDPNDEQSLVNWFGYWSTLRMDQFRHFYVLGSDDTMTARRCARGEREIAVPTYTKYTINDPDSVMKATLELYQARNAQSEQPAAPAAGDDTHMATNAATSAGVFQAQVLQEVQSDLFTRADKNSFTNMLRDLGPPDFNSTVWVLYMFPVSWSDSEMADHYYDFAQNWATISTWFNWAFRWGGGTGKTRYNTYVGFFYTIAEEWDPSNKPNDRRPKRHPWLAFYRPKNAYRRPWSRDAELIIWDPAAPRKFGDREPTEGELTFMQRQVVQHTREHGPMKNIGTELTDVWLGGYKIPDECHSVHDLDVVTLFLQAIGDDAKFKEFVPAPYSVMRRSDSGYKRVRLTAELSRGQLGSEKEDVAMDTEESDTSEEEDARIIFHPPRGTGRPLSRAGPSKCRNRLYEEARLWRNKHGPRSQWMRYQFRPTLEWYKEQEEEGRGFSHIANSEPSTPSWPPRTEPTGSIGESAHNGRSSTQFQLSAYGESPLVVSKTSISSRTDQPSTQSRPVAYQESPATGLQTPTVTPLGLPLPLRPINKSSTPLKSILKNSGTPQPTATMGEVQAPVPAFQATMANAAFSQLRISSPPLLSRVPSKETPRDVIVSEEKAMTVVTVAGYCGKRFRMPASASQEPNNPSDEDMPSLIPASEFYKNKKRRTSENSSILVSGDETPSSTSKASSSKAKASSLQTKTPSSQTKTLATKTKTPASQPKTTTSQPQTATPNTGSAPRRIKSAAPPSRKASNTALAPEESTIIPPLRPSDSRWHKTFVPSSSSSSAARSPTTGTTTGTTTAGKTTGKTTGTRARPS